MTKFRRIAIFASSILMIAIAVVLMVFPGSAYPYVTLILSFMLIIYGVRKIIYFFSMARHMVGGRLTLYFAIIILDLGLFTATLSMIPLPYVMIYLLGGYAFAGAIDMMRAAELKKYHNSSWKFILGKGVGNISIALLCLALIFVNSTIPAVYVFAGGIIYSAVTRMIQATRKTAVVYIQ